MYYFKAKVENKKKGDRKMSPFLFFRLVHYLSESELLPIFKVAQLLIAKFIEIG